MVFGRFAVYMLLAASAAACAEFDSGRPFDASKADQIKIGTTTKKEVVELLGPPHTTALTPMAGYAPGMQTMPMAPMQGMPGPMGGDKDTEYWTYQYEKRGALITSPFTGGGSGTGVSLQLTFKKDVVSECILTNTELKSSISMIPYYTSGSNAGTTHQRRCGETGYGQK